MDTHSNPTRPLLSTKQAQSVENFRKFHKEHPEVWDMFEHFTFELIWKQRQHGSGMAVLQRLRWETMVGDKHAEYRINNNFVPAYVRMFHLKYPAHDGFFRQRASYFDFVELPVG